jgi:uncharacterized membrane protein
MFEFFFKYPFEAFAKGQVVLLARWPVWVFLALVLAGALAFAWPFIRTWSRERDFSARRLTIWVLQTATLAMLLLMLWQPALSVATLRPQQNIVAIVADDSKSMAATDNGVSRRDQLQKTLNQIKDLEKKFQVRLYRAGAGIERIDSPRQLNAQAPSTRLGDALKQVTSEAGSLPIGAVILLSDGADNAGGIDLPTLSEIRRYRIPIHTVGFGAEKLDRDIEIVDAQMPTRVLAESRLGAQVTLKSYGYQNRHVRLNIQDAGKTIASKDITIKADGKEQTESVIFSAGAAGIKTLQIGIEPQDGEENRNNNTVTRLVSAESSRPRILYIEGEPKWEFKFIRRAIDLDQSLQLTSMLRTTQNKIYRQGIDTPAELEQGFPATVDELFKFQGIIIGGVEANYFTPTQQELLKQFVDRRGGGLLWLGGRSGLADGGWERSALSDLLPVNLPDRKDTFHRDPANVELTAAGRDSLLCRLDDDPARNVDRWKKLPYLQNFQEAGTAKPGAVVLAELLPTSRGRHPLLVTQNYGRGRTAVFATAGSWRWQMSQPLDDKSHEMFWQQMLRWMVSGTHGPVVSSVPQTVFADEQRIPIRVEARDKSYLPLTDGHVEATVIGPGNTNDRIELRPDPATPGMYTADYAAVQPGSYVVEAAVRRGEQEIGRDVLTVRREDGVAENFRTQQNRELLEKLASETHGKYYRPEEASRIPKEISYSEAGISVRETRDLWDMPIFFLAAILLRSSEWLLRRRWGLV